MRQIKYDAVSDETERESKVQVFLIGLRGSYRRYAAYVRCGSFASIPRCTQRVRFTPDSGHAATTAACPFCADSVEKVFCGWRPKILRTADAFRARRREGPHHFIQKRPPVFVSTVEVFEAVGRLKIDFRRIFGAFDFRLLQKYLPGADISKLRGPLRVWADPDCLQRMSEWVRAEILS